jgi:hypothetical protein
MTATYLVGDVHGHADKLIRTLQAANLIGEDYRWIGGESKLWLLGDFFNRGPEGISALKLLMALQVEAAAVGGEVNSVIGNHDVVLLAAYHFSEQFAPRLGNTFFGEWQNNGGVKSDLEQLTPKQVEWLSQLPALALVEGNLLAHADACFYTEYGSSIDEVNQAFAGLFQGRDSAAWDRLLDLFSEHQAFTGEDGLKQAQSFLDQFGGQRFIHGHTPINKFTGQSPKTICDPLVYAKGLCINLDGGLYLGGPGFFYQLPNSNPTTN